MSATKEFYHEQICEQQFNQFDYDVISEEAYFRELIIVHMEEENEMRKAVNEVKN